MSTDYRSGGQIAFVFDLGHPRMSIRVSIHTVAGAAVIAAATLRARPAPAAGAPAGAPLVPDTFTVASRALGEPRRVNVHVPTGYARANATRFPVLYMPDGGMDEDFPHVVATVDSLIALHVIRPVIVVGIPNTARRRDLTGPTRVATDSAIAPHVGGSAAFRAFLRDELLPAVDARYRTTSERAIVGESLAGLFVAETFLTTPTLFTHYVAFDPSIWWNHAALLDSAPSRLAAGVFAGRTLFLSSSRDDVDGYTARLAAALRAAAPRGLAWTFVPRPDLTHATIFHAAGPAALAGALR
ncbi:MAG: alpha/beta hydrolase [Gemmatirosa sp.]|nr:alpha/beta hydrolase [Gemmatirosa sp.]